MKKRILLKILSLLLALSILASVFSGCSRRHPGRDDGKISIVATIFPQYDFARRIAGDRADIHMLLKPGMEAHSYEPSPKDIIDISKCDLFLNVGGESESWLSSVLESADNPDMKIIAAMDCVEAIEEETVYTLHGVEAVLDHPFHDLVRDEAAGFYERLGLQAQLSTLGHLPTEKIAG